MHLREQNLRCFPHCCGGHNPKSFCGSGLVVECFLPKCQIVLGRFEEVAKPKPKVSSATSSSSTSSSTTGAAAASTDDSDAATTILVGHEYSRKELFDEVKVPDQPFGKWFRGTLVPKAADRACFLLNGNRQSWHYGWQSSRLNCKNLHVFKVYVFNQSETSPSALQCVAELASPAFRISSSRKARKTVRSPVMHPLASPTEHTAMPLSSNGGADSQSGAMTSRVPSIDELLSKSSASAMAASERFPSQQRRSLVEPLTLLEQQQQHARAAAAATASSGYQRGYPTLQRHSIAVSSLHAAAAAAAAAAVAADNAHARRERKRLTRSASLKSDYYATVAFPPLQPPVQQQPTPTPSFSLAATHPPPQFAFQQPQQQQQQRMTPLPSVAYMNGTRMLNARRSSLAALPMPSPAPLAPQPHASLSSGSGSGATAVTTPIMDMMQLRLESPHPQDAYRQQHVLQQQQQQRLSLSAFNPSVSLHQHAYASAKPLSFTRRDFAASWSAGGPGPLSAAPAPAPPVYFPMIPASSPEGYLNRKRNRSTDSDKGLLAAIQASEALLASARGDGAPGIGHHAATDGATAMDTCDEPGLASVAETDSVDLHRRARVLQLAFTIVKRIHRFEEVSKSSASASAPRVYRHSFEMVIPASRSSGGSGTSGASSKAPTLVQIPLSNHHILHLCSSLVSVCTSLLRNGVLLDIRQRLVEYAQAGVDLYSAYAQIVDFIDDAVHELVCQLPKRQRARDASGNADGDDAEQWDLYDLLKNAEAWLIQEPWWCATDDDDDSASRRSNQHDDSSNPHADLPYYHRFADFYEAIQSALPSPRDLEVAASLRDAALNGVRGLTGEWLRQGSLDDLSAQRPKTVAASASASASLSWLARQIHGHMTQVFHLTETATTMTLALPQSLISSEAVFLFDLDRQEPTVVVPQDYFPFGWTRKRLLVAYRAWRVRGIGDENGSAVAVQFMRWPDDRSARGDDAGDSDDDSVDDDDEADEPEEEPLEPGRRRRSSAAAATLLRTRVTIYFSVFSHSRLQVRTIVEGSMGAALPSPSSSAAGSPPPASVRRGQPTEADMMQYFKSPSSWELMSQVTHEYERKSLREIL